MPNKKSVRKRKDFLEDLDRDTKASVSANASNLKTHLGQYLRKVKQGIEVTVLDRKIPVAKLIPFSGNQDELTITKPVFNWREVYSLMAQNSKNKQVTKLNRNSLFYLTEDREK